jgi:hypothetical protein
MTCLTPLGPPSWCCEQLDKEIAMQPDVGMPPPPRWRACLAAGVTGVVAVGSVWLSVGTASAATNTVAVTVNAGQSLATVGSGLVGANVAIWDGLLTDPQTSTLLKNASTSFVRYPGGSYGDTFHWQTNTAPGGYVAPNTDFDHYMTMVRAAAAQPIVIANYGSGTAQEAADWVCYANVTKGYGVKHWEIGNGSTATATTGPTGRLTTTRTRVPARTPRTSCSTPVR